MASSKTRTDPFDELITLLLSTGILDETDAKIYVFGLKKGIITSGGILRERIVSRQSTGADRLRRLSDGGYFESTIGESKIRGRGHGKKYKAIPPEVSLLDFLLKYGEIQGCIDKIRDARELLSEEQEQEDEIWLLKPQKVALHRIAGIIQNAKQSIKIFSHDCTWFDHLEIRESFSLANSKKIDIQIFATKADERTIKGLKKVGISVSNVSAPYLPFCLIDNSLLLLPCTGGTLSTEYLMIMTSQKYLVDNFMTTFDSLLNQPIEPRRAEHV